MAGKNKIDIVKAAALAVLLVSLVLVIVGVCISWISNTVTVINSTTYYYKLSELTDIDNYGAMAAFAYITLALAALALVVAVANLFVKNKIVKLSSLIVSVLLIVAAVVSIALSYSFCANLGTVKIGSVTLNAANATVAVGSWLVTIFGVLGGVAGVIATIKK